MIKSWWRARAEREKKMLTAGGMVVLLIALYGFIILPLNQNIEALKLKFSSGQQQLAQMERMSNQLGRGVERVAIPSSQFVHAIQKEFPAIKISMQNNTVLLQIKEVSFQSLFVFLQKHSSVFIVESVSLKEAMAHRGMVEGMVSLQLK